MRIFFFFVILSLSSMATSLCAAGDDGKPKIAIVIDDFGLTYPGNVPDEKWMNLAFPITFAVMPDSKLTLDAAQQALKHGHELMIHFPFDPYLKLEFPEGELLEEDLQQVMLLLSKSITQIPGAKGVNNHRGVKATAHRRLMDEFMKQLKKDGLYFIDSLVTADSVAYDAAKSAGVKAKKMSGFLDEAKRHDKAFCAQNLRLVASRAKSKGSAVGIGHHYFQGTYQCLTEEVPKLQRLGFEFVFASEIVE